jgi:DNA-binding transcriptional ArsR family regulator
MFAAMGGKPRLRIMQLLLTAHPQGLVVGDIQDELGIPASTLSHHLEKLKNEELVKVRLDRHRRRLLSPARDGNSDDANDGAQHNRPNDPHGHLRQDGHVEEFPGKRGVGEHGIDGVVVRSPTLAAIPAHSEEHHDQDRDAGSKGVSDQSVPQ